MRPMNIALAAFEIADSNPELLAIVSQNAALSYQDLRTATLNFAWTLRESGVCHQTNVIVKTQDVVVSLVSLLATALLGARWSSASTRDIYVDGGHELSIVSPEMPLTDGHVVINASWFSSPVDHTRTFEELLSQAPDNGNWLTIRTSGTTGQPKALALDQFKMLKRSVAVNQDFVSRKTVVCCLFPPTAFPYITRALAAFINGCTLVDGRDVKLWRKSGVNFVVGSPRQVDGVLGKHPLNPKIPVAQIVGSPMSDEMAVVLLQQFDVVFDTYASSETNRTFSNRKYLDAEGYLCTEGLYHDSEIQIVDDAGCEVSNCAIGHVRVRNTYLADGYLNNDSAQERAFRDGWFYPGDLGRFGEGGSLKIIGRSDDVINLGGEKIDGSALDALLNAVPGIRESVCFRSPFPESNMKIFALVVPEADADFSGVGPIVAKHFDASEKGNYTPSRLIAVEELPRSEGSGKVQRWKCAEVAKSIISPKAYDEL